jgi:hypothetical protein
MEGFMPISLRNSARPLLFSLVVPVLALSRVAIAQASSQTQSQPGPASAPLPVTTQLKKTVVFIEADCEPTPQELAQLSPEDLHRWQAHQESEMPPDSLKIVKHPHSGTAFYVEMTDVRLPEGTKILYLVTNRHVAQPGVEDGAPCKVFNYQVFMNLKNSANLTGDRLDIQNLGGDVDWFFSDNESVDLAVTGVRLDPSSMDYMTIPISQFVTQEMIDKGEVVEGDPLLFSGLFIQYHGTNRLEPIVRSGTLAMIPREEIETTLHKPGHIYFAEAHSYGGNSGSPVVVDTRRISGQIGFDYKFLGVIAGMVPESNDFHLQVTTDLSGSVLANSGVCVVVPADELLKILLSPKLSNLREAAVEDYLRSRK